MEKSPPYIPFSLSRVFLIAGCILFLLYKYSREHPVPEWDTSPDNLVISFEKGPVEIPYGYIPDFQIWGDGRIVWVNYEEDDIRKVFQGYLSHDELKSLVQQFVDAGYFHWIGIGGSSFDSMRIQLQDIKRERHLDANKKISRLVDFLRSGAGVEQTEFIPTVGYLYVVPVDDTDTYRGLDIKPKYSWPKNESGLSNFIVVKDNITADRKITGDELKFFWEVANHSSLVEADGDVYWIAVEVPKISFSLTVR